jgi:hypothetical protein
MGNPAPLRAFFLDFGDFIPVVLERTSNLAREENERASLR